MPWQGCSPCEKEQPSCKRCRHRSNRARARWASEAIGRVRHSASLLEPAIPEMYQWSSETVHDGVASLLPDLPSINNNALSAHRQARSATSAGIISAPVGKDLKQRGSSEQSSSRFRFHSGIVVTYFHLLTCKRECRLDARCQPKGTIGPMNCNEQKR